MLFFLIFLFMVIFLNSLHPFFMSLSLGAVTFLILGLINSFSEHWLNLVIVLTYLGGILVIFVYVSSVVPNLVSGYSFKMIFFLNFGFLCYFSMNKTLFVMSSKSLLFLSILMVNWVIIFLLLGFLLFVLMISIELTSQKFTPMRIF